MLLENISIGKTVEIYVDREGYRYRLVSKVEETSTRRLCVTAIAANGKAFMFRPEDDIKLVYRDPQQMWEWTKVRAGLAKLDGSPVHYFEITNKGKSFNRRNAYRVQIDEELEIGYYDMPDSSVKSALIPLVEAEYEVFIDPDTEERIEVSVDDAEMLRMVARDGLTHKEHLVRHIPKKNAVPHMVKSLVKDISVTGIGLYCSAKLELEDSFFVSIPSSYGLLGARATIVRCMDMDGANRNRKYPFYYGCVYTKSDQRLIKYIYDVQRKLIKKQREQKEFENSMRSRRAESHLEKD